MLQILNKLYTNFRKSNFLSYSIIIIFGVLLASTAATDPKLNFGSSRIDKPTLPLMLERPDWSQNSFKQSGSEKSSSHDFPEI